MTQIHLLSRIEMVEMPTKARFCNNFTDSVQHTCIFIRLRQGCGITRANYRVFIILS